MANWIDSAAKLPEVSAEAFFSGQFFTEQLLTEQRLKRERQHTSNIAHTRHTSNTGQPSQAVQNIAAAQSSNSQTPQNIIALLCEQAQPLVIRDLVAHWPAVIAAKQGEILPYLAPFATPEPITIYRAASSAQGRIFYNDDFTGFNFQAAQKPMSELLSLLQIEQQQPTNTTYYMGSTHIGRFLPDFAADNNLHGYQAVADYFTAVNTEPLVSLWLGTATQIAAHYDFPQNIACCIAGERRFVVMPPEAVSGLYVGPLDITPSGQPISLVNFAKPDLQRFPRFADVMSQALVADLAPGDAIYIPSMWWHQVSSNSAVNGLVNYWWRDTPAYMGTPTDVLHHALLSLKSLPMPQKQAWQALFEHFIFSEDNAPATELPQHVIKSATWQQAGLTPELAKRLQQQIKQRVGRLTL